MLATSVVPSLEWYDCRSPYWRPPNGATGEVVESRSGEPPTYSPTGTLPFGPSLNGAPAPGRLDAMTVEVVRAESD